MRMCPHARCTPKGQRISGGNLARPMRLVVDEETLTAMMQPLSHHDMGVVANVFRFAFSV